MSSTARILVVDDLADSAILLKKMLRTDGHEATIVENGPEALEYVGKNPCDRILLDVMMPGMGGLEVSRRLKADPNHRFISILLVAARSDLKSIVEGLDAGADDYITKPVERQDLLARVRSALRVRRLQADLLETRAQLEVKNQALETSYRELLERTREKERLQDEVSDLRRSDVRGAPSGGQGGHQPGHGACFQPDPPGRPNDVTVLIRGETGTGKELVAREHPT